jgi:hypothetical protein
MRLRARLKMLEKLFGIWKPKDLLPLVLISEYVSADADGNILEPNSGAVDSHDGERHFRLPGESVKEFTSRLVALSSQKAGSPRQVFLFAPDIPPVA